MLTVIVKSTDENLTTVAALKMRLFGSTSTSTGDDVLLAAMISAASRWAENFIGYPLTLQSYEETLATYGTRRLMLKRTPLRALRLYESTEDEAFEVTSTQFRIEDRDSAILSRDDGWPWTVPSQFELEERPLPGEESQPWYATYAAGYTYNGVSTDSSNYSTNGGTTDTGRTLPADIEEAVLLKCRNIYQESVEGGQADSEELGDLKVTYRSAGGDSRAGAVMSDGLGLAEFLLAVYRRPI